MWQLNMPKIGISLALRATYLPNPMIHMSSSVEATTA